jgi:hypothetical protein
LLELFAVAFVFVCCCAWFCPVFWPEADCELFELPVDCAKLIPIRKTSTVAAKVIFLMCTSIR